MRQREIARPDVDAVDAWNREDLVELLDAAERLDHRDADHLLIGVTRVGTLSRRDPHGAVAAAALGRVTAGASRLLCLLRARDEGDDDTGGAEIEGAHHDPGLVGRDADERRDARERDRLEHRPGGLEPREAVLEVDAGPVEAALSEHLGCEGVGDRAPAAERRPAGRPGLPKLIAEVARHGPDLIRRVRP